MKVTCFPIPLEVEVGDPVNLFPFTCELSWEFEDLDDNYNPPPIKPTHATIHITHRDGRKKLRDSTTSLMEGALSVRPRELHNGVGPTYFFAFLDAAGQGPKFLEAAEGHEYAIKFKVWNGEAVLGKVKGENPIRVVPSTRPPPGRLGRGRHG